MTATKGKTGPMAAKNKARVMYKDPLRTGTWQYGRVVRTFNGSVGTVFIVAPENSGEYTYDPHVVFLFTSSERGRHIIFDISGKSSLIGTQEQVKNV